MCLRKRITTVMALVMVAATVPLQTAEAQDVSASAGVQAITWPVPRDQSWPGVIELAVDATDLDRRIQRVSQTLPVGQAGRLTLLYPRWLPGTHGPSGDVSQLAGLTIHQGEQRLAWVRDTTDPYAFHVVVPKAGEPLSVRFDHLSALSPGQGRVHMSRRLLGVQWNQLVLYPAGHFASAIQVRARLRLPDGWRQASALRDTQGQSPQAGADGWVGFAPTSLETLVDSPLFAGPHAQRIELDAPGASRPVSLNLFADSAEELRAAPEQIEAHRALVRQADRLFGQRHWRRYDFLLAISDHFGGIGLEHHESSENGVRSGYFKNWDKAIGSRELLPHEFVHSWNGKFRRPLDLWTPQFNVPMRNSLLWVYEGMTQYWGHVLASRSGLTTAEQARDRLAHVAAYLDHRAGRVWRNLQDTTNEGTIGSRRDKVWRDWQRGGDYYDEATLLWLDADSLIREMSGDKRSLDDFARAFFGVGTTTHADGSIRPLTYTFEDVVRGLDAVQPFDWARFLRERLDGHGPGAPLAGLARTGWALVFTEEESLFARNAPGRTGPSGRDRPADFQYSLGVSVASDGRIDSVMWGSPAFQSGLVPGMQVAAVHR